MNLFKQKYKTQYFLDGIEFDGSEDCIYFCALTNMNEEAAKSALAINKLTFDHRTNKLIKKERFWEGTLDEEIPLTDNEKQFQFIEFDIKTPGHLITNSKSINHFGGNCPEQLIMPTLKGTTVSYLGMISKEEKLFEWLDFDLHLVCPTFLDFTEPISIDYSNPNKPVFINKDKIENNEFCNKEAMKSIKPFAYYSKQSFSFSNTNKRNVIKKSIEGYCGIPDWDHEPFLPYCPKTGKKMEFVLNTVWINAKLISEVPESINQGGDTDLFFSDGNLHIFFQPESKVLTYFAQYS
ncbi:conserved protein of unknown function [Tenacibaculum sp. 190130A14a]|uniref:DUF1963 domain-containing protein n=1 Tax=Tenacibaculum polynesiense TaxID=3137857 RepID=A0ABM9PCZ5_9FLAO